MKRILSLVVAFAAMLAWGKDVTWTGAAENNKWSDDGNWDKVPAAGDTMVFNGAGDLAVSFESYGEDNKYLPGSIRLVLEAGATLDLMGGTLTVERFTGDKSAVNGTIVETNPRQGMVLIVR